MSLYSVAGRCILTSDVFEILEYTKKGYGGEIQLTDAMKKIAITKRMIAFAFEGKRIDIGTIQTV